MARVKGKRPPKRQAGEDSQITFSFRGSNLIKYEDIRELPLGSRVLVRTRNREYLSGVLVSHSDWLVGCPVVKLDNGDSFGAGYDGEILGEEI